MFNVGISPTESIIFYEMKWMIVLILWFDKGFIYGQATHQHSLFNKKLIKLLFKVFVLLFNIYFFVKLVLKCRIKKLYGVFDYFKMYITLS